MEQLLPLPNHAQIAVVENDEFYRHLVGGRGDQLLNVHLKAAVAGNGEHRAIGDAKGGADRGRQAESHGPQTAGGDVGTRLHKLKVLRGPHLILTDVSDHDGSTAGVIRETAQNGLRPETAVVDRHFQRTHLLPGPDPGPPVIQSQVFRQQGIERCQDMGDITDDGIVHANVLVDGSGIDIDVDFFCLGGKGIDLAGDPVVKTGSDGDEAVALVNRHVGGVGAVHAQHAEKLLIVAGKRAQAVQGQCNWNIRLFGQPREFGRCVGKKNATAGIDQRPFGFANGFRSPLDGGEVAFDLGFIAADVQRVGAAEPNFFDQGVLADIHQHRAGPACRGDVKGLADVGRDILRLFDEAVPFGDGSGDAGDISLLKGVVADEMAGHLTGEHHNGNGIHIGVGDAGDGIGGTGSGGDQHHARFSSRLGIPFGHVGGALFVSYEDVTKKLHIIEPVIQIEHGSAGIAEYDVYVFASQTFKKNVGTALST